MRSSEAVSNKPRHQAGYYERYGKRLLDVIISAVGLVLILPLLLVLTLVGMVKMGGNPFFAQERVSKDETVFRLWKFRTMTDETDAQGELLPDEERLTPYGRFLRSTSLDELPQLWNILKGDMALVGPRPLPVRYLPRYSAEQQRRHEVRAGLTGLSQVHGRNSVTWEERFRTDVWYVDHISLLGDVKIVCLTVVRVLEREGIGSKTEATMEEFMGNETQQEEKTVL